MTSFWGGFIVGAVSVALLVILVLVSVGIWAWLTTGKDGQVLDDSPGELEMSIELNRGGPPATTHYTVDKDGTLLQNAVNAPVPQLGYVDHNRLRPRSRPL